MSTDSRDFDRFAAERMLSGGSAVPPSSLDPLADLLAAAAAPGREAEFAGEEAAVAAFRAALSPQALSPQESRSGGLPFSRFFTAKVAAVALAATAAGGVAVAATTGALPIPSVTDPGGPTTTVSPATSGSSRGTAAPTKGGNGTNPTNKPTPGTTPGTPDTSPAGLCRTLASGSLRDGARALRSPAFAALVAAAGGVKNVPAYCHRVLKSGQAHSSGNQNRDKGKGKTNNDGKSGRDGDNKGGDDTPKKDDDKGDGGGKGDHWNGFGGGHGGHWHGPRWGDDSRWDGDGRRSPGAYGSPDRTPDRRPGLRPGSGSDSRPDSRPGSRSGSRSDSHPGTRSDSHPGSRSDSRSGARHDLRLPRVPVASQQLPAR